jgi:hypothetical protein
VRDNTQWFWTNYMLAIVNGLVDLVAGFVLMRVLLFHMYLWKKGITTYEHIKKIRYLEDEKGKPLEKTSLSASFSEKSLDMMEQSTNGKDKSATQVKRLKVDSEAKETNSRK